MHCTGFPAMVKWQQIVGGSMRVHLAIIFSLICGPAMADENSDIHFSTTVPLDKPFPTTPHNCESFYPPGPLLNNIEGRTLIAFTVTADGRVADPVVKTSSGDAELDNAAKSCVLRWTYRAAVKDGAAVAAPWMAMVQWKQKFYLTVVSAPHCNLPPQARTQKPGTKTEISFIVKRDGAPDNIDIIRTSDDSMLDKAVADCVTSLRFEPYRGSDGKPVDYPTGETVIWTPPD